MRHLAPLVAVTALLLAGCADDPQTAPDPEPTESTSTSEPATPSEPPTSESQSASPTKEPEPSPDDLPVSLLDWRQVPGPVDDEVTVSGKWKLSRAADGSRAQLSGPAGATYTPPAGFTYSDVLMDGQYAVVVAQDEQETKPNVAEVVDLATGGVTRIDGRSDPATTTGGAWALGSGFLVHATQRGGDYCLAVVDLASGHGRLGPCVPPRHGISNVVVTPAGISAMTFDAGHPSCRTLNAVQGTRFRPLGGVTKCKGWDVAASEASVVWSEVSDETKVEVADFHTIGESGTVDLGPGTSGSLTWCGDAAYFVRDPQRQSDPARLVRVSNGEAEVVYESPGHGKAFLGQPRCGGTDLTVTAFTSAGDEQVTAKVG